MITQSPFYLFSWAVGVCMLWLLWSLGIKRLFLDLFRERLFELRFQLFRLGMTGELPFDSETYRTIETLMCGLLRFGHRITFLTYIFGAVEQHRARQEKDYVDVAQQIALKISLLEPGTRDKLKEILEKVRAAIVLYSAFTSILFLFLFVVYKIAGRLDSRAENETKEVSFVIEREAYRAETTLPLRVAMA